MALIGNISVAMTANISKFSKGLSVGRSLLSSFGSEIMGSARLAEELRENLEKLDVVFGGASGVIVDQAGKLAEAFGTSKIAATALAEKLGGVFKAAGIGEEDSADMTAQLMTLAQAMANFSHIPIDQALGKIKAGLAGKGKALSEFGIGINDSKVKTEAYASGMVDAGGKLDNAAKVQARFNILMREGAGVIDQMGDRANDRANAFREFWSRIENIREEFGEKLPAPVESFFAQLNVGLVAASTAWQNWSNDVIGSQNDLTDWGQGGSQSVGMVQKAVGGLADAFQVAQLTFLQLQKDFNAGLVRMVQGLVALDKFNESWEPGFMKGRGAIRQARPALEAFADDLGNTIQGEMDKLQGEWAKPWASDGIDASFDAARKKLHDLRTDLATTAKTSQMVGPNAPSAVPGKDSKHAFKFAEAAQAGSAQAYSIMAHSQFQNFDLQGKVAANSDRQVELLEEISDHLATVAENSDSSDVTPLGD